MIIEDKPAIAFVPQSVSRLTRISSLPVDRLSWPLASCYPDRLKTGRVSDMSADDHLVLYPRKSVHLPFRLGIKAQLSLIVSEPDVIHMKHVRLLKYSASKFYKILTINSHLLAHQKNARFFPITFATVDFSCSCKYLKTKLVSLIASKKNDFDGHKLRHEIVRASSNIGFEIDVMGRGYRPIDNKSEGLKDYRYSIVIENSIQKSYFTEKIIDALVLETVPIYWGAPDIGNFFDMGGIIQCRTKDEILRALKMIGENDYNSRRAAIRKNKESAIRNFANEPMIVRAAQLMQREIAKDREART